MKRNYIKLILSTLLCATSINVSAYQFEVDGIYYNILDEDLTVAVTYKSNSYNSYSGHVAIPATHTKSCRTILRVLAGVTNWQLQ